MKSKKIEKLKKYDKFVEKDFNIYTNHINTTMSIVSVILRIIF